MPGCQLERRNSKVADGVMSRLSGPNQVRHTFLKCCNHIGCIGEEANDDSPSLIISNETNCTVNSEEICVFGDSVQNSFLGVSQQRRLSHMIYETVY